MSHRPSSIIQYNTNNSMCVYIRKKNIVLQTTIYNEICERWRVWLCLTIIIIIIITIITKTKTSSIRLTVIKSFFNTGNGRQQQEQQQRQPIASNDIQRQWQHTHAQTVNSFDNVLADYLRDYS